MIKLSNKHTLYEIWNEYHAEMVFVDHKPNTEELLFICEKESWIPTSGNLTDRYKL
jgi:hypothetical protein